MSGFGLLGLALVFLGTTMLLAGHSGLALICMGLALLCGVIGDRKRKGKS